MVPTFKKKISITNTILFALVTVFLAVYFYLEHKPSSNRYEAGKGLVVSQITINNQEGKIQFSKNNDTWLMNQPLQIKADQEALSTIATMLEADYISILEEISSTDLAKFSLEEPDITVQLNDITVSLGDNNQVTYNRYIKVNDTVYTANDLPISLLKSNAYELISKTVINGDLASATLSKANETIKTSEEWMQALRSATAISTSYHEDKIIEPLGKITITYKNQDTETVYYANELDQLINQSQGIAYTLNSSVFSTLLDIVEEDDAGTTGS